MKTLLSVFYERLGRHIRRRWWMAVAYYDWMRDEEVNVIFPFHYAVMFAWWLNMKWCKYKGEPSWIDKQIIAAFEKQRAGNKYG